MTSGPGAPGRPSEPAGTATSIHIRRASIGFAAAHFNCLDGGRELLHGHNYTVGLTAHGEVRADGAIVDFAHLKEALRGECAELDHRMLVPTRSTDVAVERLPDGHVSLVYRDGARFLFPQGDCAFLPLPNATCEALAGHLLGRLRRRLGELPVVLEVAVEEAPGQGAVATEAGVAPVA
ncbi:MAG TPA: 6-carboxytetrahydropterin synthase [Candidatus Dormibacteraeota bacterium]|nr:6-carboxytetrahydropterin synthase [Candidatus Dormibacteraeota bacterium]